MIISVTVWWKSRRNNYDNHCESERNSWVFQIEPDWWNSQRDINDTLSTILMEILSWYSYDPEHAQREYNDNVNEFWWNSDCSYDNNLIDFLWDFFQDSDENLKEILMTSSEEVWWQSHRYSHEHNRAILLRFPGRFLKVGVRLWWECQWVTDDNLINILIHISYEHIKENQI